MLHTTYSESKKIGIIQNSNDYQMSLLGRFLMSEITGGAYEYFMLWLHGEIKQDYASGNMMFI